MRLSSISLTTLLAGCSMGGQLGLNLNGHTRGASSGPTTSSSPATSSSSSTSNATSSSNEVAAPEVPAAKCKSGKDYFLKPGVSYKLPQIDNFMGIALADVNGDGYPDLVTAHPASVSLNRKNGTFAPAVQSEWPSGTGLAEQVVGGDFDGDGNVDLVGAGTGGDGHFTYMLGNGDGTFGKGVEFDYGGNIGGPRMVTADFNHDGKLDIAASSDFRLKGLSIFLNPGDGKLGAAVTMEGNGVGLVKGDFNGDGKLDLATYDKENVYLYAGKAGGMFGSPKAIPIRGSRPMPSGLVAGDFDGDGKLDIAALAEEGWPSVMNVLYGNGKGGFRVVHFDVTDSGEVRGLAAGDLNGDGKTDLVVSNRKTLLVYMADAHGVFGAPISVSAGWEGQGMSGEVNIVDLDRSGLPSIVVYQGISGTAVVLRGACE